MIKKLTKLDLKYALVGGAILGGGGGGSMKNGALLGEEAFKIGTPILVSIDNISDKDIILTVSAVGAPAAKNKFVTPMDYIQCVIELEKNLNLQINGIITNENGGSATINGWLQSAYLNIPLIDAPCNGRAHPTGAMGSMNLTELKDYISYQSFSGGNPKNFMKMSGIISGTVENTAKLVRQSAILAGGVVAVARNPIDGKYVKNNCAIGGISQAINLGEAFYKGLISSPKEAIINVCNFLKGEIITSGKLEKYVIETSGGFDIGYISLKDYHLTFWNEYMTLEKENERISSFPDLIMTFDNKTGFPITTAELIENMDITIIKVDKQFLKLSSTMSNKNLLKEVENIIGKNII